MIKYNIHGVAKFDRLNSGDGRTGENIGNFSDKSISENAPFSTYRKNVFNVSKMALSININLISQNLRPAVINSLNQWRRIWEVVTFFQ